MGANADHTRAVIAAFNERDLDAVVVDYDEDTEWVPAREHPTATTHRGRDAIRAYLEDWLRTMSDMRLEVDELAEGHGSVLMVGRMGGAGAESGATIGVTLCTITTFEEGCGVRVEEFLDAGEARAEFERRTAAPE